MVSRLSKSAVLLRQDEVVRVGVAVVLERGRQRLLLRRTGSHGAGTWTVPGGWVEFGETPKDAARREIRKKVGVEIGPLAYDCWTNDVFTDDGKHCLTLWYSGEIREGEPRIMEPDKATDMGWFDYDNLPAPLFLPLLNRISLGWSL